jgi:hypothetical protein
MENTRKPTVLYFKKKRTTHPLENSQNTLRHPHSGWKWNRFRSTQASLLAFQAQRALSVGSSFYLEYHQKPILSIW